ncbi:MAG: DUF1697 domain-containing protein [Candidatus Latescibacterota bacterium]|nr:MAG: DUF1697 domain-containing protein [Candidatus Latescibacterota bacterium]
MSTYVAFLRAINVAGHAKVKMTDLRRVFEEAGCRNVRTYIQTGNVIFDTPSKNLASRKKEIQNKLNRLFGAEPMLMYRTTRDMERVLTAAPFKNLKNKTDVKLYVSFLAKKPRRMPTIPLKAPKEALEVVLADRLEAYVVSRKKKNGGYGFPNLVVEKEFDVPATSRNWSTVNRIVDMLHDKDGS